MFSATVITGISMKCWCTIPIPAPIASFAEWNVTGLPCSEDLAGVRLVEPVEDVHQRRLAGAVLAEQRVHLAAAELEVDVVVGDDARERLRDPAHLEDESPPEPLAWLTHGDAILIAPRTTRGGLAARPSANTAVATPRATTSA